MPPEKYLNARDFNVLQDRKRVILVGWKKGLNMEYPEFLKKPLKYTIGESLFSDLPELLQGEGTLGTVNYKKEATAYLKETQIRNGLISPLNMLLGLIMK